VWVAVLDLVAQLLEHVRGVGLQPSLDEELKEAQRSSELKRGTRAHQAASLGPRMDRPAVGRALDEARHAFRTLVGKRHCGRIELDQALLYRACLEWAEARELACSHGADGWLAFQA
jgi:hypothetical protein